MRTVSIQLGKLVFALLGGTLLACNTFDDSQSGDFDTPGWQFSDGNVPNEGGGTIVDDFGPEPTAVIDDRLPDMTDKPPPPISGGTLLVSADGRLAIVADPDRDRLSIVDIEQRTLQRTIDLNAGEQPGRLVEDNSRRVHVVLRGAGAILTLDLERQEISSRRSVCLNPRGIAFNAPRASLLVACAEGKLIELPVAGGPAMRTLELGADLRDVTIQGRQIVVTRFRSAQMIVFDSEFKPLGSTSPPEVITSINSSTGEVGQFMPTVAWRTATAATGSMFMVHERASTNLVEVDNPKPNVSPYGSARGCGGIVQVGVTERSPIGELRTSAQIGMNVLPVDIAVSPVGDLIAIANAGPMDPFSPAETPMFKTLTDEELTGSLAQPALSVMTWSAVANNPRGCVMSSTSGVAPTTAVAFTPKGTLLAQLREPARLAVSDAAHQNFTLIELGGSKQRHTGHEIFHRDAGAGIACASCHPEGTDDAHVWQFNTGPRRTQFLGVGLEGTAPFHWDGDMPSISALMTQVFVGRMGGPIESSARLDALSSWLFSLKSPLAMRRADDPAALRGKTIFESPEAECSQCHAGPKLTSKPSFDVGTGGEFQVPSLVGVAYRAPYLHTGCARSLRERFDPACGGAEHGKISQLSSVQLDDLIAYLESL